MTSLANLTPRERQILQLVVAGKTNKEIADEIRISIKTVEFHLDHVYTKTGLRSRLSTAMWAIRQGLQFEPEIIPS
ncbi:MAG: response regulator transcription factor [Anaerolineales bacterium]